MKESYNLEIQTASHMRESLNRSAMHGKSQRTGLSRKLKKENLSWCYRHILLQHEWFEERWEENM